MPSRRATGHDADLIPYFFLYGEPEREIGHRFVHVETIAARSRLHDWHIAPHRHADLFQLLLAVEGDGTLAADEATVPFRAPCLVAMPSGVVHGYRFAPGTEGWVVTAADAFVDEIVGADRTTAPDRAAPTVLPLDAASLEVHRLEDGFAAVEREFRWHALGRVAAIAAHLRLLLVAAARLRQERLIAAAAPPGADLALFARFRALVETGFRESRTVPSYAAALGVTAKRLGTACRRAGGRPPMEIVHARRMLEARRALLYTSMSVAEVGYALGFQDPAYFSRFFTRRSGVPPRDYRASRQPATIASG